MNTITSGAPQSVLERLRAGGSLSASDAKALVAETKRPEGRAAVVKALAASRSTFEGDGKERLSAALLVPPALATTTGPQTSATARGEWFAAADTRNPFELYGYARDRSVLEAERLLGTIEPSLREALELRLAAVPSGVARDVLTTMRGDAYANAGQFAADPSAFARATLRDLERHVVEPSARAQGELPVDAVPGARTAIDAGVARYIRSSGPDARLSPPVLADLVASTLDRLETGLRGPLVTALKSDRWLAARVATHVASLSIGADGQVKGITEDNLKDLSNAWTNLLARSPATAAFAEASNHEPRGSYSRNVDVNDPALVSAALAVLDEEAADPTFHAHAVDVLTETDSRASAVDRALDTLAAGSGRSAVAAVAAMVRRGSSRVPFHVFEAASKDKYLSTALLLQLDGLSAAGQLERVPSQVRSTISQNLKTFVPGFEQPLVTWITSMSRPSTVDFVRAMGLTTPTLEHAISASSGARRAFAEARRDVLAYARSLIDTARSSAAEPVTVRFSVAGHGPEVKAALRWDVERALRETYQVRVTSVLKDGQLEVEVEGDERRA